MPARSARREASRAPVAAGSGASWSEATCQLAGLLVPLAFHTLGTVGFEATKVLLVRLLALMLLLGWLALEAGRIGMTPGPFAWRAALPLVWNGPLRLVVVGLVGVVAHDRARDGGLVDAAGEPARVVGPSAGAGDDAGLAGARGGRGAGRTRGRAPTIVADRLGARQRAGLPLRLRPVREPRSRRLAQPAARGREHARLVDGAGDVPGDAGAADAGVRRARGRRCIRVDRVGARGWRRLLASPRRALRRLRGGAGGAGRRAGDDPGARRPAGARGRAAGDGGVRALADPASARDGGRRDRAGSAASGVRGAGGGAASGRRGRRGHVGAPAGADLAGRHRRHRRAAHRDRLRSGDPDAGAGAALPGRACAAIRERPLGPGAQPRARHAADDGTVRAGRAGGVALRRGADGCSGERRRARAGTLAGRRAARRGCGEPDGKPVRLRDGGDRRAVLDGCRPAGLASRSRRCRPPRRLGSRPPASAASSGSRPAG